MRTLTPSRLLWRAIGFLALGCGAVGIALPLVPTTPFLLVAAYAFQRSSPRWEAWLRTHPRIGPMLETWRRTGGLDRRTKGIAVVVMIATLAATAALGAPLWVLALQAVAMTGAAAFILTRPAAPRRLVEKV